MASQQLWQQSEIIRKGAFPFWGMKKFNVLTDFIKKGEVQVIGERDYRIPFKKTFGGRFGAYDPQMGDMGRGTAMTGDVMIQSFFNLRLNFELDMLAIKATQDRKVAMQDPFKDAVANGYYEFQLYLDKCYHNDGTAVLGTATATGTDSLGNTTYTLSTAFGTQRLRRGMYVNVYDTTGATLRSASTLFIVSINATAKKIVLSGVVSGAAATDKICFEGPYGYSKGLRGLYYWISSATSGTTANIDRAVEPEIIAESVDAGNGPLLAEIPMAIHDRLLNKRGEVAPVLGLSSPAQRAIVYGNVMSIQRIDLAGTQAKAIDRLPELKAAGKESFMWGGVAHYVDIHQDRTRNDYFVPSDFGRARLDEMKFFQTPGTNQRFFPLYGGSGAPAAGVWFGLTIDEDVYHIDPGATGFASNLYVDSYHA